MHKSVNSYGRPFFLVILCIVMAGMFTSLSYEEAKAWKWWRYIWLTQDVKNGSGVTCNRFIAGGISATSCRRLYTSPCQYAGFSNVWFGQKYIGRWGFGWLSGAIFSSCDVQSNHKKRIGAQCKMCVAFVGVGVWFQNYTTPKKIIPMAAIRCTSPVAFTVWDSMPEPIRYANVDYFISPDTIPYADLSYDMSTSYSWIPTAIVDTVAFPGDTIVVGGIPDESVIGGDVLVIRGMVLTTSSPYDTIFSPDDTTWFAAEFVPRTGIPALGRVGLIILVTLLMLAAAMLIVRDRKRKSTA